MSEGLRIAAIIPVAAIEGAKTRLGESLDAEERHDLVERMTATTLKAALDVGPIADVVVVSPDPAILQLAARAGARTLRQRTSGLNAGIREAREDAMAGGAEAVVVIPIDLPFIDAAAIDAVLLALLEDVGPSVVLAPDRHGTGTNTLAMRPADVIDVRFGADSRAAHREAAAKAGAAYFEVTGPLSIDLDTPEDLVYIGSLDADGPHVG